MTKYDSLKKFGVAALGALSVAGAAHAAPVSGQTSNAAADKMTNFVTAQLARSNPASSEFSAAATGALDKLVNSQLAQKPAHKSRKLPAPGVS